jgi:hypothetical protein
MSDFQEQLEQIRQAREKIKEAFLGLPDSVKNTNDMDEIQQHFPKDVLGLVRSTYPSHSDQESLRLALKACVVGDLFEFESLPPKGTA